MREILRKHKKIIIICILIGIGFIPFLSIREIITPAKEEHYDNLPYEYSQTGEEGYLCVFPPAIYTNYKLYWVFNCSDKNRHILLAVMNIENYYHYEKLAYHRENGDIISHEGNWLFYVKHYVLSIGKSSDEDVWNPPYLDWWCLVFYDLDTNIPLPGVSGEYGYRSGGILKIVNVEISIILSISYFLLIIGIYFLNRKYDLIARIKKNFRKTVIFRVKNYKKRFQN